MAYQSNVPAFNYDPESDPLYQSYKQRYMHQGEKSMRDTLGSAAALTGGYASTAAISAGQQAYNDYMGQLDDRIPELYNAAYSRYRDQVGDEQWKTQFNEGQRQFDTTFDYNKGRDAVQDEQWQKQYDEGIRQYNTSFDYNKGRDAVQDSQWRKQYDESRRQFSVGEANKTAMNQWNARYEQLSRQIANLYSQGKDTELKAYLGQKWSKSDRDIIEQIKREVGMKGY